VLGGDISLIRNVGEDVVFMWNKTSGSIKSVRWGLLNNGLVDPLFIYKSSFSNATLFGSALDTTASSYKGRVSWVGDLSAGQAWFKITNLIINDTNQYAVETHVEREITISTMWLTVAGKQNNIYCPILIMRFKNYVLFCSLVLGWDSSFHRHLLYLPLFALFRTLKENH
jgi:hypothetical protein